MEAPHRFQQRSASLGVRPYWEKVSITSRRPNCAAKASPIFCALAGDMPRTSARRAGLLLHYIEGVLPNFSTIRAAVDGPTPLTAPEER